MKDTAQQLELDMGGNSGQEICLESKQTMENAQIKWTSYKISEIFDVARGGSPRPIQNYLTNSSDGLNWIMIGDTLENSKYITSTKNKIKPEGLKKTRMVHEGDFLLTNSMSFGRPYILKISGCIHDGWLVLSPKKDNVYPDFFYYLLGSKKLYQEFSKRASGAVVKNLNTSLVSQVEIPLPPLEEQKRIARILDTADELRAKRRQALAELDTLLQSVFLDMFGDPVTNPKGWKIQTLEEITIRITDGTHQSPQWSSSGVPFLFVSNIQNRTINFETSKYISEEEYKRLTSRCPIEAGDILYTTVGSYGNPAIVRKSMGPFAFQRHIAHIKPQHELINSTFLEIMLDSAFIRQQADRLARGVAQKTINLKELKSFKIIIPPLIKQCKFVDIAEKVEQQKAQMHAHLAEFDALFASLQHRVFNGEL